jgi:hypothetical protein
MSKCKTTADVLRRAQDMVDMCKGTEVVWHRCIKHRSIPFCYFPDFSDIPESYDFAHCLLDGKPVFTGDVVYGKSGSAYTIKSDGKLKLGDIGSVDFDPDNFTWTKPTPRKMIEINGDKFPAPDYGRVAGYYIRIYNKEYFYKDESERDEVATALQKLMESGSRSYPQT